MNATLKEITLSKIDFNPFKLVAEDWMLVTAGSIDGWNTMTASWGGFGHLWNKDVAFVFVRPTRFTYGFMETNRLFTLSFFAEEHRQALATCGSVSGRDNDKAKLTGLHPEAIGSGATAFAEASLVLLCETAYKQDIDPACMVDKSIDSNYDGDYHRMYVAPIVKAFSRNG